MENNAPHTASSATAGATATSSAVSWNPALRQEKEINTPAPIRGPPKTDSPSTSEEEESEDESENDSGEDEEDEEEDEEDEDEEEEDDDEDEEPSPAVKLASKEATPASLPPTNAATSIATQKVQQTHDDRTTSNDQDEETSEEEEEEEDDDDEESEDEEAITKVDHSADNYEPQGESTALEDAVVESTEIPLMADTEAASGDWGDSTEDFDLGEMSQQLESLSIVEPVGTTAGDSAIGNAAAGTNGDSIDWGDEGETDFFGGGAREPIESTNMEVDPVSKTSWDLDLDLDDDFLPDKEDAPVFHLSDDEGFLEDEPPAPAQAPAASSRPQSSSASRYAPQPLQGAPSPAVTASQYSPQTANFAKTPAATPAYNGYGQNAAFQQSARPAMASSAQSFADKSKGGYSSPYDMPDDIVTTRKRPAPRPSVPAAQPTPPPPRTSSISSASGSFKAGPPPAASGMTSPPPAAGFSSATPPTEAQPKAPASTKADSGFFAELPTTSKSRPPSRYTPQPSPTAQAGAPLHVPHNLPPKERTASWSSLRNEVFADSGQPPNTLRQPEQLPMFPNQPSVPARTNSIPASQPILAPPSNRYSPAPQTHSSSPGARYSPAPPGAPAATSRYSPAPPPPSAQSQIHGRNPSDPPTFPTRTPSQPFAPRTSSPLAFHSIPEQQVPPTQQPDVHSADVAHPVISQSIDGFSQLPHVGPSDEQQTGLPSSRPPTSGRSETPPLRSTPSSTVGSPRKKGAYTPQYQPPAAFPSRTLSQSPSASMKNAAQNVPTPEAYPTAFSTMSAPLTYSGANNVPSSVNAIPHRRQASLNYNYEAIAPEDERANDPLQRWRGHPVFTWGLGGTIVTSFPKQIPRYGGGASAPMMKCTPGEVKIQSVKEAFPLSEDISKFPGPLKAKGKKKDVVAWLARKIELFDNQLKEPSMEHSLTQEEFKRLEDRTLLWKLMQVLVENDGKLEGPAPEASIRKLLSPQDGDAAEGDGSFSTAAELVGRSRSNTSNLQAEPINARAIEDLQNMLTKGDREKAVWHAVDQRLWGHAMLLSSTLSKDVWKQVVQEFVRNEVKKVGRSNQALAVLYEVFAGNHVDCIDELVPASARAGFQMVSTDGAGAAQNALHGLEKWRETLALILNNRSEGDVSALLSLGRLLAQYGRVEAAHICYIFARPVLTVSGADDTQADLVLIGADHRSNPLELGVDSEPILLTEVYEFALSLSAQGGSHVIPHLQNYKLAHAYQLAEYGHRADAQAYCDAIAASMKATTRISPYYNASFIASLDDLSKRLSHSPKDGSSSWISKPNMDKVSSSLLSKFNSFIAGEDEDAAATSGGMESGPFAKIAGNSPSITPSQSSADLYGAYAGYGAAPVPSTASQSRYAPTNAYAPRRSSEQARSRYEPSPRPSFDSIDGARPASENFTPMSPMEGYNNISQTQLSPPSQRSQKTQSYSPLRSEHNTMQPSFGGYMPTAAVNELSGTPPSFGEAQQAPASFDDPQPSIGHEQTYGAYEPPSNTFEAPSYQPYNPNEEDKQEEEKPKKKKSFMDMDDDDDLATRAAALKGKNGKSEADKKADEAFRKAAEADAQRDKDAAAAKKGWFGGWWGKKDPNAAPGPIRAKLGEENSFVYDPDLKKWVNKKGGAVEADKPAATPPPPRGGPPGGRSASSGVPPMGPPMGGPLKPPTSNPAQRSSSMPPPMASPGSRSSTPGLPSDTEGPKPPVLTRPPLSVGSGPPSRPGTSMSNASSIDDLLGAPQARKGSAAKKKKGGRYVDVMAQGN